MKRLTIVLLALLLSPAQAETYRIVHPDGSVEYTDAPREGAEPVEIGELNTYSAPPPPALSPIASPEEDDPAVKPNIRIVAPADGAELEWSSESVVAKAMVRPRMLPGWRIIFTLDGARVKGDGGAVVELGELGPGEHTLEARVLNSTGRRLARAESVRFSIKQPTRVRERKPLPGQPDNPIRGQHPKMQQYIR